MLSRIKPSPEDEARLKRVSNKLLRKLEREVKQFDPTIKVALLGSASRGTWLKNEKDLDFFLMFPEKYSKKELERVVTIIGKKVLNSPEKRFAEHPYIRGRYEDFEVELVPCYQVSNPEKLKSAVDRTPFHDKFVKENLDGKEDEVRLLKQFLMGIGCYGAEAKVEGFSGYLCELLVIKYKSFRGVLEGARKWKSPQVLWLKDKPDIKKVTKKFDSPLIFIDPVDSNRNVSSALSLERFSEFIYAAKEYLRHPKEEFFFPKTRIANKDEILRRLKGRGTQLVSIVFSNPGVIDDILYPQLRKFNATIRNCVEEKDFKILGSKFFVRDKICLILELASIEIPSAKFHMGPTVNSPHEDRFLDKYASYREKLTEPFIRNGRWQIILKRKYRNVVEYLRSFLTKEKLEEKGIPRYIAMSLRRGSDIRVDEEAVVEEFYPDLLDYLDPRFPWEIE
jgi:tRNA nucleotidyltransferase (CCA-adding enzyme)